MRFRTPRQCDPELTPQGTDVLEDSSPVINELKDQSERLVDQVVQAGATGDWLARAKICWAKALLALGSDDQAKAIIDNVLETGIANPEIRYELFRVKSDVALAGLNPREAHDYLVSAMDALESYRASTSSQMEFRYLFFRRMIPSLSAVVSKYIGSTARQAEREQIFLRFTQLIKGRTYVLVAKIPHPLDEGLPNDQVKLKTGKLRNVSRVNVGSLGQPIPLGEGVLTSLWMLLWHVLPRP